MIWNTKRELAGCDFLTMKKVIVCDSFFFLHEQKCVHFYWSRKRDSHFIFEVLRKSFSNPDELTHHEVMLLSEYRWCIDYYYGNQKSMKSNFICLFQSLWNVHKPTSTLIPWANLKLLGQKIVKIYLKVKMYPWGKHFLQHKFFLFYNILVKLQRQIWSAFASLVSCISVRIIGLLWFLT